MDIAILMYVLGSVMILPALLFAMWAQYRVSSDFGRFSQIASRRGLTGAQLARKLLDQNGCGHVLISQGHGHLSDHYDPRKRLVCLSPDVYNSTSLAALGVAAHEVGHAIQHQQRYVPLMLRQIVIKSTSIINKALIPLIIVGLIASIVVTGTTILGVASATFFFWLIVAFCALYAVSFVVNLITLPTEINASNRAKQLLRNGGFLFDDEEYQAISRVLGAAALTYVASLLISFVYMLRFLGLLLQLTRRR